MKLPTDIAGYDARIIRDLFKAFVDAPSLFTIEDIQAGKRKYKKLDAAFTAENLKLPPNEAETLVQALISENYLDAERLIPTHNGMALAQHIDWPPLERAEADKIIAEIKAWAARVNERADARIVVRRIDVFGSYLGDAELLSDIDLILITNKPELIARQEFEPEDFEREDALLTELTDISEYISPGDELEKLQLDTDYRQIFP